MSDWSLNYKQIYTYNYGTTPPEQKPLSYSYLLIDDYTYDMDFTPLKQEFRGNPPLDQQLLEINSRNLSRGRRRHIPLFKRRQI